MPKHHKRRKISALVAGALGGAALFDQAGVFEEDIKAQHIPAGFRRRN